MAVDTAETDTLADPSSGTQQETQIPGILNKCNSHLQMLTSGQEVNRQNHAESPPSEKTMSKHPENCLPTHLQPQLQQRERNRAHYQLHTPLKAAWSLGGG